MRKTITFNGSLGINPEKLYDSDYYNKIIKYRLPDGTQAEYYTPAGGMSSIFLNAVKDRIGNPKSLLDIGCGQGDPVLFFNDKGITSYGITLEPENELVFKDIRSKIVRKSVLDMKSADFPVKFNVITSFDFWEHIFEEDIEIIYKKICGIVDKGAIGFFVICTCRYISDKEGCLALGDGRAVIDERKCFKKDEAIPMEWEWLAVSGHVISQIHDWWCKKFEELGATILWDEVGKYSVWWAEKYFNTLSYSPRNIIILRF